MSTSPNVQVMIESQFIGGISLIGPSDPTYESAIKTVLTSLPSNALPALDPCAIIVNNTTGRGVAALTVSFKGKDAANSVTAHTNMLYTLDTGAPEMLVLMPHEVRIFSGSGLPLASSMRPASAQVATLDDSANSSSWCSSQKQITVALDSVVFDDGKIVGPDNNETIDRLNAQLDAIESVCRGIVNESRTNAEGLRLAAYLEREISKGTVHNQSSAATPTYDDVYSDVSSAYTRLFQEQSKKMTDGELTNKVAALLAARHLAKVHR